MPPDKIKHAKDTEAIREALIDLDYWQARVTPSRLEDTVKLFQKDYNLPTTGIVDSKTLSKINLALDIQQIELKLIGIGYDIGAERANGRDTPQFHAAVAAFQKDVGLKPTGTVDPKTRSMFPVAMDDVIYEAQPKKNLIGRIKDGIHHLTGSAPKDPYADIDVTTYSKRGKKLDYFTAMSGEKNNNVSGIVPWMGKLDRDGKPQMLFDISKDDPRYQACKEVAEQLKKEYPLDHLNPRDPKDFQTITEREKAITVALTNAIHKQYGDYNPDVLALDYSGERLASMHDDDNRAIDAAVRKSPPKPPALAEFGKDELICRQYATLASALCDVAGLKNLNIAGATKDYIIDGTDVSNAEKESMQGHAFVVSRLTGNVIDATVAGDDAYHVRVNPLSLNKIIGGAAIVVEGSRLSEKEISELMQNYTSESSDMTRDEAEIRLRLMRGVEVYNTGTYPISEMPNYMPDSWKEYNKLLMEHDKSIVEKTKGDDNYILPEATPLLPDDAKALIRRHGQKLHVYGAVEHPQRGVYRADIVPFSEGVSPIQSPVSIPTTVDAPIKKGK